MPIYMMSSVYLTYHSPKDTIDLQMVDYPFTCCIVHLLAFSLISLYISSIRSSKRVVSVRQQFYHTRQPRLPLELSHWLRAVEYLRCYPRVLNLGYLSSNILYLQQLQISNTEERGQTAFITPLLSCSVPGNICNRGYTGIASKIQNCVDQ